MERKIALCVSQWSADSTLYAWSYAKQYFLRKKRDANGYEVLSSLDKLYVVHVWKEGKKEKDKDKDKWCGGGPLLPGLTVALAKFPHTIVELEGQSVHSTLLEFASREGIDIMILGSKESKGTVQKLVAPGGMGSSTSDTMKSKSKCPCLIIRPASARNEKMRIKSNVNLGALLEAEARGGLGDLSARLKATAATSGNELRRVCLAFESVEVGQHMLAWATKYCLFPDDEVYIVHCHSKSLMKLANKRGNEVGPEIVEEVEGDNVNVVSNTQLKDDTKSGLCVFLEENSIDLVIVGYPTTSRLRKTLTLGQVSLSTHLLHHAPCPTLVIPYKSLHAADDMTPMPSGDIPPVSELSPRDISSAFETASMPPRPSSAGMTRRVSLGSPPGHGTYPLAILSDDDGDGDGHSGAGAGAQGGRPSRAHSLRSALQSWRSIRTTLGDRPGSGGYGTSSADEADELHGAGTQNGRRTSKTVAVGVAEQVPADTGIAVKQRIEQQDGEIAALKEEVRQLKEALARTQARINGSETA